MGAASVSEYVASLNEEQRRYVSAFIDFMSAEYPQLTPKISFSIPMWLLGKKMYEGYVAISAAKAHFSIHFSDEEFLNRLAERLPTCKKGKRCINIKYGDEQSLYAVEECISDFLKSYRSEGNSSLWMVQRKSVAVARTVRLAVNLRRPARVANRGIWTVLGI